MAVSTTLVEDTKSNIEQPQQTQETQLRPDAAAIRILDDKRFSGTTRFEFGGVLIAATRLPIFDVSQNRRKVAIVVLIVGLVKSNVEHVCRNTKCSSIPSDSGGGGAAERALWSARASKDARLGLDKRCLRFVFQCNVMRGKPNFSSHIRYHLRYLMIVDIPGALQWCAAGKVRLAQPREIQHKVPVDDSGFGWVIQLACRHNKTPVIHDQFRRWDQISSPDNQRF